MKPYALRPDRREDIGCCPGHDWPPTRKMSGTYNTTKSKQAKRKDCDIAKRSRRRVEKQRIGEELAE